MPLLMCPNDNSPMQEINRNGVLIDVCPQCRGVWMDRGELEKLLSLVSGSGDRDSAEPRRQERDYDRDRDRDRDRDDDYRRKKRKKRFELFDFFD
ncbi:MAG TPA: zf-TFIIB domain-containing protein [Trueperaceae bacterium]